MKITVDLDDTELDAIIESLEDKIYTDTDDDSEKYYQKIIDKFTRVIKEVK